MSERMYTAHYTCRLPRGKTIRRTSRCGSVASAIRYIARQWVGTDTEYGWIADADGKEVDRCLGAGGLERIAAQHGAT